MEYEATLEDEETYTRPWTIKMNLYKKTGQDAQLQQFKCVEFVKSFYMENGVLNKIIYFFIFTISLSIWSEEYTKETWFGDPNLQGFGLMPDLTTLERPDYFESLEISDDEAMTARQSSEEFNQTLDNPYAQGETPESGGDVGGYNVAWMDPGSDFFKLNGKYRSSIITYPESGKLPRRLTRWAIEGPSIYRMFTRADHPEERSLGERCVVGFGSRRTSNAECALQ